MKAYVINLDKRGDRLDRITAHLENLRIPMERIPAVDGQLWDGEGWKRQGKKGDRQWRGGAGCYFSHILALETALQRNVFPCIILEDDAVLIQVPEPEAGMVYLGGWESDAGIYGLHAVMYSSVSDALGFHNYLRGHKNTSDSIANRWRKLGNAKIYSKGFIAYQIEDYSDIEGGIVRRTPGGRIISRLTH
jgi:hypothetical protein